MTRTKLFPVSSWLVGLGLLLSSLAAHALTEDPTKDPLAAQAETALWWGDIDTLERLYAEARASSAVNSWNARTAVRSVRSGIYQVFNYGELNGAYFRELELLTAAWARERPNSVFAQLLHARALYARAWHVRGGGYWQTVPDPAKAEFARLVSRAEKHIAERAPLLMADTSTHVYLLLIGRSAGWSFPQMRAIADDALARSTADEGDIDEELVFALLPQWGGSWERVAEFIEGVDRSTRDRRGHELYALLWSIGANNVTGNLYKETRADWTRMKSGLERLAATYQQPHYNNRLAYFACLAEDRVAARAALSRIDGKPAIDAWRGGGAGGRQNYEACVQWAAGTR